MLSLFPLDVIFLFVMPYTFSIVARPYAKSKCEMCTRFGRGVSTDRHSFRFLVRLVCSQRLVKISHDPIIKFRRCEVNHLIDATFSLIKIWIITSPLQIRYSCDQLQ